MNAVLPPAGRPGCLRRILGRGAALLAGAAAALFAAAASAAPVPEELLTGLRGGQPVGVIVEIDASAADRAADARRARLPRRMHDAASLAQLAADYRARKDVVMRTLQRPDIEDVLDYSHLPMMFRRVRSEAALRALAALPGVRALHADRLHQRVDAQSFALIGQPPVAAVGDVGTGTTVAVIDDGIDLANAAFGGCTAVGSSASCRVVAQQTFLSNGRTASTDNSHGTNVSAIVAGVAPGAKLAALDVFAADGAYTSDIISAINWVIDPMRKQSGYNFVAINMSLGDASRNPTPCSSFLNNPFVTPIANARSAGISVVAAAGNSAYLNGAFAAGLASPACATGALSVGAVYDGNVGGLIRNTGTANQCTDGSTATDQVACFSMSASYLSLLAPGALISGGGYTFGGTSQAAPHVAGSLAVLRAAFPAESLSSIEARLGANGASITDARIGRSFPRLNVSASARPANDDFANAVALSGSSGSASGSNLLATIQSGEPLATGTESQSVWWTWTAPAAGQVTLDTSGSSFDTRLDVYTGSAVNALTRVAGNDNASSGVTTSALRFQARAGTAYRWAVDSANSAAGSVKLNWSLNTAATANLSVAVSGPGSAAIGATLAYTLTASNAGPQSATNVVATATVPAGLSVVNLPTACSAQSSTISCAAGEVLSGGSMPFLLTLRDDGLGAPASLSASVNSDVPDPVSSNNSTSLALAPGAGNSADIPTLPEWAALLLGSLLLWMARFRHLPRRLNQGS